MRDYCVGDRVRYTRGIRWTVHGREGVVLSLYTAHGAQMLVVDFGTEVYRCWVENVDLVPEIPVDVTDFSDIEIETAR